MRFRSLPLYLFLALPLILSVPGYCYAGDALALTYNDRGKILVLLEKQEEIQIAPGEFAALAGTEYFETEKMVMNIDGDSVGRAVIARTLRWGIKEKDPRTWNLMGICGLKEGTTKVSLSDKEGKNTRVITVTVKKHPEDWKEKLLTTLKEKKVSVEFKGADFESVAKVLSEKSGLKIVADYFSPEAKKNLVTYSAENKPLTEILDESLGKAGLAWVLTNNYVLLTKKVVAEIIKTQPIIEKALDWLSRHQFPDGSFSAAKFTTRCSGTLACDGAGDPERTITTTAFALLAFMGYGYTHRVGDYKETVSRAKDFLLKSEKDGAFGEMKGKLGMLDSLAATCALCELYAITRDNELKESCEKAVQFVIKSQRENGGWCWEKEGGKPNTLATAFAVLALKAATVGRIEVPKEDFDRASKFFESLTNSEGKVGYEAKGDSAQPVGGEKFANLPVPTAASVIASIFCGETRKNIRMLKGIEIIEKNLPQWDKPEMLSVDPLYWYFATYATFDYGGERWHKLYEKMIEVLSQGQENKGCADGSWKPVGRWGELGGRMFNTALNALTAEIIFRYLRGKEMLKYEGK